MFLLNWINRLVIDDSLIFFKCIFLCVELRVFHGLLLLVLLLDLKHLVIFFRGNILSLCFIILGLKRVHSISKIWLYVNANVSWVEKTYKIVFFFLEMYTYFSLSLFTEGLKFSSVIKILVSSLWIFLFYV